MEKKTDAKIKRQNFISLQKYCIENHMVYLLNEWDYKKNGCLVPENVTTGSEKKVWWCLPYNDKKTGKHFNFEWRASIANRVNGSGCPYLSGKAVWRGFNDLAITHPELAAQWHPVKNGSLTPENVTAGSNKNVWWLQSYDDEDTGKHFDFEWAASITKRVNGRGCPFLTGHKVWKGFNDLETYCRENGRLDILNQWDYEKNNLLPSEVTAGSGRKVWWKCSICGHGWKAEIINRRISGCPKCAKEMNTSFPEQAVSFYLEKHFPDAENGNWDVLDGKELDVYIPSVPAAVEYDGVQYHKSIRRDLDKNRLCMEKGILLIRIREEGCPAMEDALFLKVISCIPKKEDSLADAIRQAGEILGVGDMDVDIERDRQEIYSRYIKRRKENSLAVTHPELAVQWDYEKNGNLTPENVTAGSNGKVWWLLPYDDRKTGRHFDFSWQASIANRARGTGCPFLTGKKVWKGFNDLETYCRENEKLDILSQWDYEKNGDLKPSDVTVRSQRKVWWIKNGKSKLSHISNFVHK